MFCPMCGIKNENDARFCENCGKQLVDIHVRGKKKSFSKTICLLIILAVFFVGTVFVNCFRFPESSNVKNTENIKTDGIKQDEVNVENIANIAPVLLQREEIIYHIETGQEWMYSTITEYDLNGNEIYISTDFATWNISYDYYENGTPSIQYFCNLEGDVTSKVYFDEKGNVIREGEVEYETAKTYMYEYDNRGRMLKKTTYWLDENETTVFEQGDRYIYDVDGELLQQIIYYDEEFCYPVFTYCWEYNEEKQLTLHYIKNAYDEIVYQVEYNPLGNEETVYSENANGTLYLSEYREYNEQGDLLMENYYSETGEMVKKNNYMYEYTYDEKGNFVEKQVYLNDELFITIKRMYY